MQIGNPADPHGFEPCFLSEFGSYSPVGLCTQRIAPLVAALRLRGHPEFLDYGLRLPKELCRTLNVPASGEHGRELLARRSEREIELELIRELEYFALQSNGRGQTSLVDERPSNRPSHVEHLFGVTPVASESERLRTIGLSLFEIALGERDPAEVPEGNVERLALLAESCDRLSEERCSPRIVPFLTGDEPKVVQRARHLTRIAQLACKL